MHWPMNRAWFLVGITNESRIGAVLAGFGGAASSTIDA